MNKILLIALTLSISSFTAQAETNVSHIDQDLISGIYYKYENVIQGNGVSTVNYSCFIDYPNNPYTNQTHGWLSLGYKSGTIGLNTSMKKLCLIFISSNTP